MVENTGSYITQHFLLKSCVLKTSSNGSNFIAAELQDKDGIYPAKMWDADANVADELNAVIGGVVKVRADVQDYKGTMQLIIKKIRPALEGEADLSLLVPVAPIDVGDSILWIRNIIDGITDTDYRAICTAMFDAHIDQFSKHPAGKSMHHAFVSGLLMHTCNVMRIADSFATIYPFANRSLLVSGAFLHDMGKLAEIEVSTAGMATDYSIEGQLLGHLVMGAKEIATVAQSLNIPYEKSLLLQHMLLSHHGKPELGAAIEPRCLEAELLHLCDLTDSRVEMYRTALNETAPGTMTERLFNLQKRVYCPTTFVKEDE